MEQQLEEIRDQQKASWNKFSGGWKKMGRQNDGFYAADEQRNYSAS
ncbi:MAG: hypothetical protein M3139_03340 [Bacteroidota bacterium]|nr:hypothetical protein [Bacteroidota bacterium]